MGLADTLSFFVALVAISIAPGPVVLMQLVRAGSNDTKGATGVGLGWAIGGVLVVAVVFCGLGAWLTAVPAVFEYSKYFLLAYFFWLARRIWNSGFDMSGCCKVSSSSFWSAIATGLGTCLVSPYMMILFPLIITDMLDANAILFSEFAIVSAITFLGLTTGAALVVLCAAQLQRVARSAHSMLILNRSLATVLVGAGGWMTFA
jgi:threonine/homoserine/homoserine lactone efflux protein